MSDSSRLDAALDYLTRRLSEPSTWRGLTALATAFGITIQPDLANAIMAAGLGVIGVINVIRKEKGGTTIVTTAPVTVTTPTTITTQPEG